MAENRKSIIVNYSPFTLDQTVHCWVNGDCTEVRRCAIHEIPSTVNALRRKYQIQKIELVGPREYVEGLQKDFVNSTFDFKDCEISIINR